MSDQNFCAGFFDKGKAPDLGDSGGGLYVFNSTSHTWSVNSIISWSVSNRGQIDKNLPPFYTNGYALGRRRTRKKQTFCDRYR